MQATSPLTSSQYGSAGFGNLSVSALIFKQAGLSLSSLAIIANLPQLILSALYFLYNSIYTSMLLSREWCRFSVTRQSLRVSRPIGLQHRAHALSIPSHFAAPLIIIAATSHWIQSQALFLARVDVYDSRGESFRTIQCLAYSPIAWVTMLARQFTMMVVLLGIGSLKYPAGIPIVQGWSLAISAACHPPTSAPEMAVRKLKYGRLAGSGEGNAGKVGLSSDNVEPLESVENRGHQAVAPTVANVRESVGDIRSFISLRL